MTLMLNLTTDLETLLNRRAAREGQDAQTVALRLLTDTLTHDNVETDGEAALSGQRSMADLFVGRVGVVSGSGEAWSENGGPRFGDYLTQKHGREEAQP